MPERIIRAGTAPVQILRPGVPGPNGLPGTPGATGATGPAGAAGATGAAGVNGWTPILATVLDGLRRVLQVVDWAGGTGSKPTTGQYVGPTGLVSTAAAGVDIRGPLATPVAATLKRLSTTPMTAETGARNVVFDTAALDAGFTSDLSGGAVSLIAVAADGWYHLNAHVRLNAFGSSTNTLNISDSTATVFHVRGIQVQASMIELFASGLAFLAAGTTVSANLFTTASTQIVGNAAGSYTYLRVVKLG